jgi:hypothetical protein
MNLLADVAGVLALLLLLGPPILGRFARRSLQAPAADDADPTFPPALRRLTPSAERIADKPPSIDVLPLLRSHRPLAPPAAEISLLGVTEDRDAADQAIWRNVKRELEKRTSRSGVKPS